MCTEMLFKYVVLLVLITNVWCESLYIYEESIGTLDESFFADVKDKSKIDFLDLRGTGIVRILDTAFQGFDNLNTLVFRQNNIECLPEDVFRGVQNVNDLQMQGINLKYLHKNTFSTLRKLRGIGLRNNLLTKLEVGLFDNTVALEALDLEDNKLTYIPEGLFSKLNNLRHLNLALNYIHGIDRNSMPSAVPSNLRDISIWTNRLQYFDIYDSVLNSLSSATFDKNPWYCDCKLKRLFKKYASTFRGSNWPPACQGPEHLRNRPWTTLQESDFVCGHNIVHFNIETNKFPRIGEDVVLACHINIPVGEMTITYKNGTNVVDHLRRQRRFPSSQTDSSEEHSWLKLTIKNVQPRDTGSYMCVINGKVERSIYFTVDDPKDYEKCLAKVYFR